MTDQPGDSPSGPPAGLSFARAVAGVRTPARIGLGRVGASLPTAGHLAFQLAHARARDAVHAGLDTQGITRALAEAGLPSLRLRSMAPDRDTYLRRPDLGRRLDPALAESLSPGAYDLAAVLADGLSATAVNRHAVPVLRAILAALGPVRLAPVAVVEGGRVALGDEVGAGLGAACVVVLIGERPGLSAADSLGAYITWAPRPGRTDAERNCVSNIRPEGLGIEEAGATIAAVLRAARRHETTGVALSARAALPAGEASARTGPAEI